jgi:uncharacterized protein (TIGR02246 family)
MRSLPLILCLLAATPALAQPRAADEAAIRKLVADYVNARDLRSAEAIGALFTADADQHTTAGEWRRGRAQIVPGTLDSSRRNPGDRRIVIQSIRFLNPDAAIADGPYEIGAPGGEIRRMWTTLVLTRAGGLWRIAAIRNATPTSAQRAATPAPR